jgi:RNA polymerase sigma-70 factor (ECF subfamily)
MLTPLDRDLVDRCVARQPLAWQQFVDRYLGLLHHAIRHTAAARSVTLSSAEVEDLAADMLAAFVDNNCRILRRFRGRSSLATYVAVIARRWTVNHLARKAAIKARVEAAARDQEADSQDEPSAEIDDRDEVEALVRLLPEKPAALVRGRYLEGKTYEQLAAEHEVPVNSVGPTLARAMSKLRKAKAKAS